MRESTHVETSFRKLGQGAKWLRSKRLGPSLSGLGRRATLGAAHAWARACWAAAAGGVHPAPAWAPGYQLIVYQLSNKSLEVAISIS